MLFSIAVVRDSSPLLFISHLIDAQLRKPYVQSNYSSDANVEGYEKDADGRVLY